MGTNFHTAWIDKPASGYTEWSAASMNVLPAALDKAITYLKNIMVGCEGALTWNPITGVLAWDAQLTIVFNRDDGDACHNHVAAGDVTLAAGQFAYCDLSETDGAAITVSAATITPEAASNFLAFNRLVLAYRSPTSGSLHGIALGQPFVVAGDGGIGDVVGPAGATDGNLAEFDEATGKLLKDGSLSHDDVADAVSKKHSDALDHSNASDHAAATAGPGIAVDGQEISLLERNADLTLYPEYPGAVLTASGSDNDPGTLGMTSDSEVVSNVRHNYYEWKSDVATPLQSYDISVQIPIPANFTGFQAGTNVALTLDIKTEENAATNNAIDITINRDGQATTSALTAQKSATAATWETIGFDETDAVLAAVAAGETLNVLIRLYSMASKYARVGKINLKIKVQ
jgi:hypothetical protein